MKLGGPILKDYNDPESWVKAVQESGYKAANCPVGPEAADETIKAYAEAAAEAGIIIAECGVWNNPISRDQAEKEKAVKKCKETLKLADKIGTKCCVNIAGSKADKWDGPHPDNLSDSTFQEIVDTVREIIDAVEPENTFYTLEPMPWVFPDSPDSYLNLIEAVDREAFGVHLDPVNLINSPYRYFNNAQFLEECFEKLGKYIKSCHAKDTLLTDDLTTYLKEVRPGAGSLSYSVFLKQLNQLEEDIPLMLEHLSEAKEYEKSRDYIKQIAAAENISL